MNKSLGSRIPLFSLRVEEKGAIRDIKEIVVRISGLPTCLNGQIVNLGRDVKGIVMGFDAHDVLALVLGDRNKLRIGSEVSGVSEPFTIPVGDQFIGRMVTALGVPCDQKAAVEATVQAPVFQDSAPLTHRAPMDRFLETGTKVVDVLVPLAKGQRQLILGDRMTGKTAIGVDAIVHQGGRNFVCIYCAIGKSVSALGKVTTILHQRNALDHTIIMVATDNAPVGEQFIIPYAAASMGGYFARKGRDVLIVFDDLTKHAWAYRQLSLLLERPPGREAYPGDIFYVQTQLMERAGCFNEQGGSGSMTFLGIAETLHGDLAGYIPSNLASMCDGQIFLNATLFAEGNRPAVDILMSNSIVGGRAHPPVIKALSRKLRADFARYIETSKLSKLQSGVTAENAEVLRRGRLINMLMQQAEHQPFELCETALLLYALERGMLNDLNSAGLNSFFRAVHNLDPGSDVALRDAVARQSALTQEIEKRLHGLAADALAVSARMGSGADGEVTPA